MIISSCSIVLYVLVFSGIVCGQVHSLQSQVDSYRQEQEQFELIRADWQIEKDSLECVLMELRQELKTREETLSATRIAKVFKN